MSKHDENLAFQPAHTLAGLIQAGSVSSVELTQFYIDRIERLDGALNAVVVRDFERALEAARAADQATGRGEQGGPLHGVPMTIKESYDIAGLATTWGEPQWRDMVAREDSAVVAAFKRAGAVFLGKTNVPLMLGDYQSYNAIYGQTNNPWDMARSPGGSSGGSAAAMAAGLSGLESGSDIGGSIRNPAHYCGVYGHKPTWGVVPMTGHKPPPVALSHGIDLAVVGPLARSAADLKLALDVVGGPSPLDAPGWRLELPPPRARRLDELRVAFWHDDAGAPVDAEIAACSTALAGQLRSLGATVFEDRRPEFDLDQMRLCYISLLQAALMSGVPADVFEQNRQAAAAFDRDDMSPHAVVARAAVQSYNDWALQDAARLALRHEWQNFFRDVDVLVCPISTTAAFPHDHSEPSPERTLAVNGQARPYFEGSFWAGLVTMPGLPATVFPAGRTRDGLPIGLQAVSAQYNDHTCIEFARLLDGEFGGFEPPPDYA